MDAVLVQRIVDRHDGAAGVTENDLDPFVGEDVEDEMCPGICGGLGHAKTPIP
jgi:hypothetical protein